MKYKQLAVVVVIVVVIHAIFLLLLKSGGNNNKKGEDIKPEPEVTEIVEQENVSQPEEIAPPAPEPVKVLDPLEGVEKFSNTFFTKDIKALPENIRQMEGLCKSGIAIDLDTKRILWEKDAYTARPMASVTKMMTALVAVRKMKMSDGAITPDTMIKVTPTASKIGGRQVWLDPRESFSFTDILKCVLVHSANDCAYLMGEFMGGGDVQSFINDMNKQAADLGCTKFNYVNTHGLTNDDKRENVGSPIELAYLASVLLDIPEITRWTNVRTEYIRENDEAYKQRNKGQATMLSSSNGLLRSCNGVNGMKTGFTNKAGFCIVITCERNGRRAIVVVMGSNTAKERDKLGAALVNWIYQN